MKKILLAAVVAVGVLALAGGAFAAPPLDVPVNVTAAVTQKCIVASPGTLDITIDPDLAGPQAFTAVDPVAQCTKTKGAATAAVTAASTNGFTLVGAGLTSIPYAFTFNNAVVGNGFGAGAPVAFGIGGSVAAADANVAEFGAYTDTVTLTLAY